MLLSKTTSLEGDIFIEIPQGETSISNWVLFVSRDVFTRGQYKHPHQTGIVHAFSWSYNHHGLVKSSLTGIHIWGREYGMCTANKGGTRRGKVEFDMQCCLKYQTFSGTVWEFPLYLQLTVTIHEL